MSNENKTQVLMKNNTMVKAKYNLNPVENKVFQLILFSFQKHNDNTMIANISRNRISEILNGNSQKTEKGVANILLKLRKSDIYIFTKNGWQNYGFLNKVAYNKDIDTFTLEIHKEIYDLLIDYLNGYTPINLSTFFGFKSFYSQRFYELLRLWSNTKTVINYSLEDIRELLMLGDKYQDYRNFKKRVITTAVKELNQSGLMQIEIKENKINRKVVSIDFIVKDLDKRVYFKDKKAKVNTDNKKYTKKELKFKNFDERTYDYDSLEKKLLGWEDD